MVLLGWKGERGMIVNVNWQVPSITVPIAVSVSISIPITVTFHGLILEMDALAWWQWRR